MEAKFQSNIDYPLQQILNDDLAKGDEVYLAVSFVMLSGVRLLEDNLKKCIDSGGMVKLLFGEDFTTTEASALIRLRELGVELRVHKPSSNGAIYHPKIWLVKRRNSEKCRLYVGSSNMSQPALVNSVEANFRIEGATTDRPIKDAVTTFERLWESPDTYLVTKRYLDEYLAKEKTLASRLAKWRARAKKVSGNIVKHTQVRRATLSGREVIMQILGETRRTQVQIPMKVLRNFFNVQLRERAIIRLKNLDDGTTKMRPIVWTIGGHHRMEIDAIKDMARPLIIRFLKDSRSSRKFSFDLHQQGTSSYNSLLKELKAEGEQTVATSRLFLIR